MDQNRTPLFTALKDNAAAGRTSWHMPGHAQADDWPDWLCSLLPRLDNTELPTTDDLNRPRGPAREAMELAAAAYGAGYTRFLTSGSTTAIYILLAATVGLNGEMLTSRTCHQSVLHAAALLNITVRFFSQSGYVQTDRPGFSLLAQATAGDVERALANQPDCRVVWLTSPDYYGSTAEIGQIAAVVHKYKGLLLVDEAHGAHFAFADGLLPPAAMAAGADACVQSGHKTLPVLTGGSMVHVAEAAIGRGAIDIGALDRFVPLFQSSSPSFPIAATLDRARSEMARRGKDLIARQLELLASFREDVSARWLVRPPRQKHRAIDYDPLRLVLTMQREADLDLIPYYAARLRHSKIDIEFHDLTRLVLIPSLNQTAENWQALSEVLNEPPAADIIREQKRGRELIALEQRWRRSLVRTAEPFAQLAQVMLGKNKTAFAPVSQLAGKRLAVALAPYPPGIALAWPGEVLTAQMAGLIESLLANNIAVNGVSEQNVEVLI